MGSSLLLGALSSQAMACAGVGTDAMPCRLAAGAAAVLLLGEPSRVRYIFIFFLSCWQAEERSFGSCLWSLGDAGVFSTETQ